MSNDEGIDLIISKVLEMRREVQQHITDVIKRHQLTDLTLELYMPITFKPGRYIREIGIDSLGDFGLYEHKNGGYAHEIDEPIDLMLHIELYKRIRQGNFHIKRYAPVEDDGNR